MQNTNAIEEIESKKQKNDINFISLGKWQQTYCRTTFKILRKIVETRPGVNCAGVCSPHPKQKQYRLVLVDTWWYKV